MWLILCNIDNELVKHYHYPHCTDEGTEPQEGGLTSPGPHNQKGAEPGFKPGALNQSALCLAPFPASTSHSSAAWGFPFHAECCCYAMCVINILSHDPSKAPSSSFPHLFQWCSPCAINNPPPESYPSQAFNSKVSLWPRTSISVLLLHSF